MWNSKCKKKEHVAKDISLEVKKSLDKYEGIPILSGAYFEKFPRFKRRNKLFSFSSHLEIIE